MHGLEAQAAQAGARGRSVVIASRETGGRISAAFAAASGCPIGYTCWLTGAFTSGLRACAQTRAPATGQVDRMCSIPVADETRKMPPGDSRNTEGPVMLGTEQTQ